MSAISGNCLRCQKLISKWCSGDRHTCEKNLLGEIEKLQQTNEALQNDLINANMNLEHLSEELKQREWIPVSERLPEKPEPNPLLKNKPLELYLVAIDGEDYAFRAFWNGKTFTDGWDEIDVTAWQPLPQPYKEAK